MEEQNEVVDENIEIEKISFIKTEFSHYLDKRLDEWANWFCRQEDEGLGFKKQSIEYLLHKTGYIDPGPKGPKTIGTHKQAEEIEYALKIMAQQNQHELRNALAIRAHYIWAHKNHRVTAARLGISPTQYRIRVAQARQWVMGWLISKKTV